jgi:hypothetical protein
MPCAWYFSDHWGFDLSVSHLDLVARRERTSFSTAISKQRRYHRSIEWRDERSFTTLPAAVDVRPCQWVAEVRIPFCLGVLGYPMFGPCRTWRGQKKTRVVMPLPEGFRFSSCYHSAFAVFGPLTWSLDFVDGYELSRMLVAMLINWCSRMSHALRYFQLIQPWICRAVVEVVCNDFGAEAWSFLWRYGWAGLQFLFRSEVYFFIWTKTIHLWPASSMFAGLSDSQPSIDRGIWA